MYKKSLQLNKQITNLQQKLQTLPDGKLICCDNKDGTYKWYCSDGHHKTYIPKKNRQLAKQLALKKYLTLQLEEFSNDSETLIDTLLYLNKIPFRYECALHLDGITLYPDFTIRHPQTGKVYYWEHFGLMDDESYAKNAFFKQQTYATYGIIPTQQLITTYETKNSPLSSDFVEKIIQFYFL